MCQVGAGPVWPSQDQGFEGETLELGVTPCRPMKYRTSVLDYCGAGRANAGPKRMTTVDGDCVLPCRTIAVLPQDGHTPVYAGSLHGQMEAVRLLLGVSPTTEVRLQVY